MNWFSSNAKLLVQKICETKPASNEQIQEFKNSFKTHIPRNLEKLLLTSNGAFQLHEGYILLSVEEIIENLEINSVDFHWNKNYVPFAKDIAENFLIIEMTDNEEKKIISWCKDIGVNEELNANLGLYIEELRNMVLKGKLEYIEDVGFVERVSK